MQVQLQSQVQIQLQPQVQIQLQLKVQLQVLAPVEDVTVQGAPRLVRHQQPAVEVPGPTCVNGLMV